MRPLLLVILVATSALAGCGDDDDGDGGVDCTGVVCGACQEPFEITILLPGAPEGTTATIDGIVDVTCGPSDPGSVFCFGGSGPGVYSGLIQAVGYQPLDVSFEVLADTSGGCCNCGYFSYTDTFTLTPNIGDAAVGDAMP